MMKKIATALLMVLPLVFSSCEKKHFNVRYEAEWKEDCKEERKDEIVKIRYLDYVENSHKLFKIHPVQEDTKLPFSKEIVFNKESRVFIGCGMKVSLSDFWHLDEIDKLPRRNMIFRVYVDGELIKEVSGGDDRLPCFVWLEEQKRWIDYPDPYWYTKDLD